MTSFIPKISVIMPVYNAEKYLDRSISSILSQSLSDFELILVNDGSTDSSAEICDNYAEKDSRVKIINKHNGGVSSARNLGIEKASGKWLCFADSDDIVKPGAFKALMNCAPADLVVSEFDYLSVSGNRIFGQVAGDGRYCNSNILDAIAKWSWMYWAAPWNKLYLADIIHTNNIRFNTHITIEEDLVFNFQYLLHVKSMVTTSAVTYSYCENTTSSVHKEHSFDSYSIKNQLLNYVIESLPDVDSKCLIRLKYLIRYMDIVPSMYKSGIEKDVRLATLSKLSSCFNDAQALSKLNYIPGMFNKSVISLLSLCGRHITDIILVIYFKSQYLKRASCSN